MSESEPLDTLPDIVRKRVAVRDGVIVKIQPLKVP